MNIKYNSLITFSTLLFLAACSCPTKKEQKAKIEELKIQLTATEAQLLNVSSELAKCKSKADSAVEFDSTIVNE